LQPLRVLLVEDQALVAMEFEAMLVDLGCVVVGPVGSVAAALNAAQSASLNGAVLDISLAGETSFPVASYLQTRRVPFFFVTGLVKSALPERLQDVPCLAKPVRSRAFAELVRGFAAI
jgi:DNA-binding NarL/FixJ family response regulator